MGTPSFWAKAGWVGVCEMSKGQSVSGHLQVGSGRKLEMGAGRIHYIFLGWKGAGMMPAFPRSWLGWGLPDSGVSR